MAGNEIIKQELMVDKKSVENTKVCVVKTLSNIKRFQERIRNHIEDKYVKFMPNHTTWDMYLEEGGTLLHDTEYLLKNVRSGGGLALTDANEELIHCVNELRESSLGLRVSYRILKIDELFQCLENAKSTKDFLVVLDIFGELKYLIFSESVSDVDRLFQSCDCYDTIKVKYHIQYNNLQRNLLQKFDRLIQFSEKSFPATKNVTLQVSTHKAQLQDTVLALFQARYNPIRICNFLLENCFVPIITKPVSLEYLTDNADYSQLSISYSVKELGKKLRPSYKNVFAHITSVLDCLSNINVNVFAEQYVFTIIGNVIKDRLLKVIVNECLLHAVPETIDEYQQSTLVPDINCFEQMLADVFFIDPEKDRALSEFSQKYDTFFKQRFGLKALESAREIMHKDIQDMIAIAEGNLPEEVLKSKCLFPQCKISKNTLELVKLMERILYMDSSDSVEGDELTTFLRVIPVILNTYVIDVPKLHQKLIESIPQQSALFYNNCMFLAHWVAKKAESGIAMQPTLVKSLQATGEIYFEAQVLHQQKILMQILKEFDISDTHSIGSDPMRLLRQCLRQLELLKNVWLNVIPDPLFNTTFCNLINDFCHDIIKRIISLEDISSTVANELSELIAVVLDKAPQLFNEKRHILQVPGWLKLQHLKMILNASLQEIMEQWCEGAGILTANFNAGEIRHLIRALFQNTDRRANALTRII